LNKVQQHVSELIPKQIELTKDRKKLNRMIDVKNKYIDCISTKDEEDCSDIKEELDKLEIKTSSSDEGGQAKTHIVDRTAITKIRQCSQVTREDFPDFKAVIALQLTIDSNGFVSNVSYNPDESVMNYPLEMFPKCVAHFSKDLRFFNPYSSNAKVNQNFIFSGI
jgi:hypothetical protein